MSLSFKGILSIALGFVLLGIGFSSFKVVPSGSRGVYTTFGAVSGEPLGEGLHFINPVSGKVVLVSIRQNNFGSSTEVFTIDNQAVVMNTELVWSVDPKFVNTLYSSVGDLTSIETTKVANNFLGALKDAVGKQNADTLVQNRSKAAEQALAETKAKLEGTGIIIHTLNFTNLQLNHGYQSAVENKMIAKQLAEKAKNDTVTIEEQAKQTVKTAQAEAEAMRIKSQALAQNKGLVEFEAVQKWDGKLPQYMFGQGTTPFIDMRSLGK